MERMKKHDIERAANILNKMLANAGALERVHPEGRYGYIGLDAYDLEGRCRRTVKTGLTKRAAVDYLDAMIEGISIFTRKS